MKKKAFKQSHILPIKGKKNPTIENRSKYLQFDRRQEDSKHTISIERPSLKDKDILKKTEGLIKAVFTGHPAAYYDKNEENTNSELAKKFYDKYYNEADITKEAYGKINIENFMIDVFLDKKNGNKNKISFLLGDVGVGKTAFINYLISKIFPKTEYKDDLMFIRIDVENQENETTESIASYIIVKFITIIRKNFNWILTEDSTLKGYIDTLESIDNIEKRKSNFHQIIEYIYNQHNIKLALLIDNIDIVYHKSKLNFFDTERNKQVTDKIDDLVKFFVKNIDEFFDSLYANMLFVMRRDTFEYIKSKNLAPSHVNVYENCDSYIIKEYDWDEILSKRFAMLYDLLSAQYENEDTKTIKEKIKERIENIASYLEPNETTKNINLIATIQNLTNFGLREMMDYLNNYSYISYFNTARFLKNEPVGLMAFILHGYQLYSDNRSLITNVFMNYNTEQFKPITYWLKYFIIKYISKRTSNNIETVIEDINSIFISEKGEAYTKEHIKMILKTLTDSNQSNIIEVKKTYINGSNNKPKDKLTLRTSKKGETIINEMVFKFYYLQLMIDDNLLPFPQTLLHKDLYHLDKSKGYSYLLFQGEDYSDTAKNVIKEKGQSVIYFLTLLKTALEYEKNKYSDVYKNLSDVGIELIDMEKVISDIKSELKALYSAGTISAFTPDIESYFAHIDNERKIIETGLQSIFNNL
jgi:GTPase SAR1 family protein